MTEGVVSSRLVDVALAVQEAKELPERKCIDTCLAQHRAPGREQETKTEEARTKSRQGDERRGRGPSRAQRRRAGGVKVPGELEGEVGGKGEKASKSVRA